MTTHLILTAAVALVILTCLKLTLGRSQGRYPPGPKPHPLWKNILDFPRERPWLVYDKWKKEYGDIVHLDLMGQHMVVLNSLKACTDLLEKRSSKYSDRPRLIMIQELMGWDWVMGFKHYTPTWRAHRKLFHQFFNEQIVGNYQEAQERHVHTLLKRLLHSPEALQAHIRLMFAEIIMDVVYGLDADGHNDKFVKTVEEAMRAVVVAGNPGAFLVDVIPLLKHVPAWVPGAGFQKVAAEWRVSVLGARDLPVARVKEDMAKGKARPCVLSAMLNRCDEFSLDAESNNRLEESPEVVAAGSSGAAFTGGADTTLAAFQMFFLLMAKHPDIQKAAQDELDRYIGRGRLPTLADVVSLPYLQALVKELSRWHNVAPLGLPHATAEDDVYEGYFIPKGTIISPNVWSILHDPERYHQPERFNPSRWLVNGAGGKLVINKDLLDPTSGGAFGFGRRVCPGRHFATNTLYTVVPCILACFSIFPRSGSPEDLCVDVTSGTISYPLPYEVSIKPRSAEIARQVGSL